MRKRTFVGLLSTTFATHAGARVLPRLPVLLFGLIALFAPARSSDAQVSTRYIYDAAGQLIQIIQVDGATVTYEYDAVGNLLRRLLSGPTDPGGAVTAIYPTVMGPASEAAVTIFGVGLTTAVAVTFDVPGITASLERAPDENAVSLLVRVDGTVAPGPHAFTVQRSSLPPISGGTVVLNVTALPVLLQVAPDQVLTGNTIDQFNVSGARLDRSPTVLFDRPGLALTNVTASPGGTSLTGRLQVALNTVPGPVGVSVTTSEGTTKKLPLTVGRSVPGLTGSYFANAFTLDSTGLPVVPVTSPSFIRSDAALQFGTSTGFKFRPCFIATTGCLNSAYTVRWQGYIFLESAGTYTFALNSSDASQLLVGGASVVPNPGSHAATTAQGVFVAAAPGSYPVVVLFNTSGVTPGIDLLYRPPGATTMSPVPGTVLWGDGSVYDPVLTSAAAAVSVANPATPASPGGTNPVAGASSAVSFVNPAPTPQPGGAAPTSATAFAVSFFSPAAVPEPGGTSAITAAGAAVSFSNPAPITGPGSSEPLSAAVGVVGFASGPVVYEVTPMQLSRGAGGGVLTIRGRNMQDAIAVLFENGSGISASAPSPSVDGSIVTTTVTLTAATPTGFVGVKVSTPTGVSVPSAATVLEIVP